ncbi:8498_t:CDS:2, partial [Dentiscutata erythropus]
MLQEPSNNCFLTRGDGGMDMFGNHNHYLLLFQCKDLTNKVEQRMVIRADIPEYLSKVLKDNSANEKIYRIEKKVDEIIEILKRQE